MKEFINEKFSSRAKHALKSAHQISLELGHQVIGTEHLLYGLIAENNSFAFEVLLKNAISKQELRLELARGPKSQNELNLPHKCSSNLIEVLDKAVATAAKYRYQFIGTEHFLFGIVDNQNKARDILKIFKVDTAEIHKNLLSIFENVSKFPEFVNAQGGGREDFQGKETALEYFTNDLSIKAREGKIDPLIGRSQELQRVISILGRRTKNNPVLIGEPGVGKTAIVEGLASAIFNKHVPDELLEKRILVLDLALVIAGSMFRGEFETRMKQIIEEIKDAGDIILFIDELHTLVGAGATTGSLDAANILKPALARGEIRTIGATTFGEYKKYIEPDTALERRFQPIIVKEPSAEEAVKILLGLKPYYEAHHNLDITTDALEVAVRLSERYITDRFLPDKAIDLVDETASFYRLTRVVKNPKISLETIARNLADLLEQKRTAIFDGDFATAKKIRLKEAGLLQVQQRILTEKIPESPRQQITEIHIQETTSRITGIPMQNLLHKEEKSLLRLEQNLNKQIIGQETAVTAIASSIRRARAGISSPTRPLGSFMFLGPSGVGKTLLAKLLAEEVFGSAKALIRIDMSEFMQSHNLARLIGAPAGYVGYEEGGRLTEKVRRQPYSVVLFDELEKAHPDTSNILLQVLDDGELTDATGKKVNFRNTIIIMTSNIGLPSFGNKGTKGFGFKHKDTVQQNTSANDHVLSQAKNHFRPELLNRIDKIIVFESLGKTALKKIVSLELRKLQDRLASQKLKLKISEDVVEFLSEKSHERTEGARSIARNITEFIEDMIASHILLGEKQKSILNLSLSGREPKQKIIVR